MLAALEQEYLDRADNDLDLVLGRLILLNENKLYQFDCCILYKKYL